MWRVIIFGAAPTDVSVCGSKFIFGSCLHISRQKYSSLTCILAYTQKLVFRDPVCCPILARPLACSLAPLRTISWHSVRHLFFFCLAREGGRCVAILSADATGCCMPISFWSTYLPSHFVVVYCVCVCVWAEAEAEEGLRTFQIIYFGIRRGWRWYLWDLRVKFSVGFAVTGKGGKIYRENINK